MPFVFQPRMYAFFLIEWIEMVFRSVSISPDPSEVTNTRKLFNKVRNQIRSFFFFFFFRGSLLFHPNIHTCILPNTLHFPDQLNGELFLAEIGALFDNHRKEAPVGQVAIR